MQTPYRKGVAMKMPRQEWVLKTVAEAKPFRRSNKVIVEMMVGGATYAEVFHDQATAISVRNWVATRLNMDYAPLKFSSRILPTVDGDEVAYVVIWSCTNLEDFQNDN